MNHSLNFVDLVTVVHMQNIELWESCQKAHGRSRSPGILSVQIHVVGGHGKTSSLALNWSAGASQHNHTTGTILYY